MLLKATVAEWSRYWFVGSIVASSSPVPLKTRRVGQRCTLNQSRAETSSRWCGVVVRREEAEFELQGINDQDVCSGITDIVDKCCLLENLNLRVRFPFFKMQELFDSILGALFQQMMDKGTRVIFLRVWTVNSPQSHIVRVYDAGHGKSGVFHSAEWHDGDWSSDGIREAWLWFFIWVESF
ncbi:hypothetical protein TNCV_4400851 [Trichonephila clavipes]|nr:hypothetical protein TNCV_4400851 [Trichonephila clavipes]